MAASEDAGDLEQLALALAFRAHALAVAGRLDGATADIDRALLIAADAGSGEALAFGEQVAGMIAHQRGDLEEAERLLTRSRDRFRRMRGTIDAGYTLIELARVALARERPTVAADHARTALADFRRRDDPRGIAAALLLLGLAGSPEPDQTAALLSEAKDIARRHSTRGRARTRGSRQTAGVHRTTLAAILKPIAPRPTGGGGRPCWAAI